VLQETVEEMTRRGPRAKLVVVPDCGHAPCLNVPDQIKVVRDFLAQ
jgi:pimeloyl-ACP methyl ester carboxylesterase